MSWVNVLPATKHPFFKTSLGFARRSFSRRLQRPSPQLKSLLTSAHWPTPSPGCSFAGRCWRLATPCSSSSTNSVAGMELHAVVRTLEELAPPALAESWDNVGLLVEPSPPHCVSTLLLTNDLTEEVLQEAVRLPAQMVLSYHPPVFAPLRSLTMRSWKERLVVTALENRVAVYSPHTCYDALRGGVNDWLAEGLGKGSVTPLKTSEALKHLSQGSVHVTSAAKAADWPSLAAQLRAVSGLVLHTLPLQTANEGEESAVMLSMNCTEGALPETLACLSNNEHAHRHTEITALRKPPFPGTGMGRLCTLTEPVSTSTLVSRIKQHLKLPHVRLALGAGKSPDSTVQTVALCAGSGGSVLKGVQADLYLTGELSHHEVLDAVSRGVSVILCEHSNTERGFLPRLRLLLLDKLQHKLHIHVSEVDRDPLTVV
ncbi:NIF3-like protein 1 [Lampetra fluviatilis]